MDNHDQHSLLPNPGWAKKLKRVVLLTGGALLLVGLVGGVLAIQFLGASWKGGTIAGDDKPRKNKRERMQDDRFLLTGVQEVDQQGERIWKDLDELQREIDRWKKIYIALEHSKTGSRLTEDEKMVRYYVDKNGFVLPPDDLASNKRVILNTLMATVIAALQENKGYQVNEETRQKINDIETDVKLALREYRSHRYLLEGRAREVSPGGLDPPETLGSAARRLEQQRAKQRFGYRSDGQNDPRTESDGRPSAGQTFPQTRRANGTLEGISRDVDGADDVPKDFGMTRQTGER